MVKKLPGKITDFGHTAIYYKNVLLSAYSI